MAQGVVIVVGLSPAGVDRVIDVADGVVRRFGDELGRALPLDGFGTLPAIVVFVGGLHPAAIDELGDIAPRIVGNQIAVGMVRRILGIAGGIPPGDISNRVLRPFINGATSVLKELPLIRPRR